MCCKLRTTDHEQKQQFFAELTPLIREFGKPMTVKNFGLGYAVTVRPSVRNPYVRASAPLCKPL